MHLYHGGMDLTLVSQWLGHSNLQTTLVYAHADTEQKRAAIEQVMQNKNPLKGLKQPHYSVTDDELFKKLYEPK